MTLLEQERTAGKGIGSSTRWIILQELRLGSADVPPPGYQLSNQVVFWSKPRMGIRKEYLLTQWLLQSGPGPRTVCITLKRISEVYLIGDAKLRQAVEAEEGLKRQYDLRKACLTAAAYSHRGYSAMNFLSSGC